MGGRSKWKLFRGHQSHQSVTLPTRVCRYSPTMLEFLTKQMPRHLCREQGGARATGAVAGTDGARSLTIGVELEYARRKVSMPTIPESKSPVREYPPSLPVGGLDERLSVCHQAWTSYPCALHNAHTFYREMRKWKNKTVFS
jgi:hypothetical protein